MADISISNIRFLRNSICNSVYLHLVCFSFTVSNFPMKFFKFRSRAASAYSSIRFLGFQRVFVKWFNLFGLFLDFLSYSFHLVTVCCSVFQSLYLFWSKGFLVAFTSFRFTSKIEQLIWYFRYTRYFLRFEGFQRYTHSHLANSVDLNCVDTFI
jgi:hypothetical protein